MKLFEAAFAAVDGRRNDSIRWYLHGRPKLIARQSFFEQARWAIWVAGMSSAGLRTFLAKAQRHGLRTAFRATAARTAPELRRFIASLHGRPIPRRAEAKWRAVHFLAQELTRYRSEAECREDYCAGKVRSRDLDDSDIEALIAERLPFIGSANAHFIVRNIGGEAARLDILGICRGLFDLVIWCYCERFVGNSGRLGPHVYRMSRVA